MANNKKYQLDMRNNNNYPLSVYFPPNVTLTQTTTIITITKSDGSQMTRKETTKQISFGSASSNHNRR